MSTTGTPSHVTGSNAGNLTTVQKWLTGSSFLTSHYHYFDTGNVSEYDDANGGVTHYTYGACGNSFVTLVAPPISVLQTSSTWNCNGGVQTGTTDPNGAVKSVGYTDAKYWRPTSTTDPLTNSTTISYPSVNTITSAMTFNGGSSTSSTELSVDGYGRPYLSQVRQGPSSSNWDTIETFYDSLGRASEQTLPYSGTAGQTTGVGSPNVTTTFDVLSRPSTATDSGGGNTTYSYSDNDVLISTTVNASTQSKKQLEYDGLGRLTSVCELTSATGSGSCAQNSAQTGFWTTYAYGVTASGETLTVKQNKQSASPQTRTYSYDHLGRLISEANPESGTTTYAYDSDATCGNSAGDRVKRIDAVANTTCYAYDLVHRPTSVSYSGTYAARTPNKTFVYDTATVNGTAMANGKGRMVEAYTGTSASKITDLGFSYTARGETSDVYESTPHSGGYYHLSAAFWPHGVVKQLSGLPGVPTLYYGASDGSGLDGEGRITKVSAASGQNPVTSVTYSSSNTTLTGVTYGSGDSDAFGYDSNTLRQISYTFNVGSTPQTDSGTLTWNVNGTLKTLAISDQLNASNSQTCNYTYDDLTRIKIVDCGASWYQDFHQTDAFGNIYKTTQVGSTGQPFTPGYDSGTNRINSGYPVSYDTNGNLTNDGLGKTYTWNSENSPASLSDGTVSMTSVYDALGRLVENQSAGSNTEVVYDPAGGKLALMNAQALVKAFVALPGAGQAVYTNSGLAYYRHSDWLGSSRLATTTTRTKYFDVAYAPYGEDYVNSGTADLSFTGHTQDTLPALSGLGLYDFLFRRYHPVQGRWISPDPAGLGAVDPSNPQTWNRYAYVDNIPLSNVDALGLYIGVPTYWSIWGNLWGRVNPFRFELLIEPPEPPVRSKGGPPCLAGAGPLLPGQSRCAANTGPNQRLLKIAQQIQNCPQFSNVGNQIAQGVNSGSISVGNVPSNGVGTTNGYFSPISVIAPDALDDPSTVIHEWIHQTQTVGNPFFIFLKGANQLQALVNSKLLEGAPEGFLDTSAQAVANKIVSVCGVK